MNSHNFTLTVKKVLTITVMIFSLAIATPEKAEAIYCSNCANWVTQLIEKAETVLQTPLQLATKISTGMLQYKEFTLDLMVTKLRDSLIKQVQKSEQLSLSHLTDQIKPARLKKYWQKVIYDPYAVLGALK